MLVANDCGGWKRGREHFSGPREAGSGRGFGRAVILAGCAVSDVEVIADDRKPHRVDAEKQLPVRDGVKADVRRDLLGSPAIPARTMARFRSQRWAIGPHYFVCCGT